MTNSLPSIELGLAKKLRDKDYRKRFFLAEASAHIAKQLIELRKLRHLTQKELAELAGTGQPAISRAERADYHNWSFSTLRRLAEAMDARIRVLIEPSEKVLADYELQFDRAIYAPEPRDTATLLAAITQSSPTTPRLSEQPISGSVASQKSAASAKPERLSQPALRLVQTDTPFSQRRGALLTECPESGIRSAA